jgi:type I site-specific restriction endonuclease
VGRQNFIKYLIEEKNYPKGLIGIEQKIPGKEQKQRTDIIVYSKNAQVLMIIECKAENVKITQEVFEQAVRYNMQYNTLYLVLTNGKSHYICKINKDHKSYNFLKKLPEYKNLQ